MWKIAGTLVWSRTFFWMREPRSPTKTVSERPSELCWDMDLILKLLTRTTVQYRSPLVWHDVCWSASLFSGGFFMTILLCLFIPFTHFTHSGSIWREQLVRWEVPHLQSGENILCPFRKVVLWTWGRKKEKIFYITVLLQHWSQPFGKKCDWTQV